MKRNIFLHQYEPEACVFYMDALSASEMTYIVSSGALNSAHSLTHSETRTW